MRVVILAGMLVLVDVAASHAGLSTVANVGAEPGKATDRIVLAQPSKESAKRPPAADAVWDVRSACLQGEVETKKVSDQERLMACDQLAKFEDQAQEVGHCWNQNFAEYKRCE